MNIEKESLLTTALSLMSPGKGILAADESTGTIEKRFRKIGVDSTPHTRKAYREMLFTTPDIERYLSGVILYDETIRQSSSSGVPFAQLLEERGILPGIKVDRGTSPIPFTAGEKETEGADGLRERLIEYRGMGARFTKWRAVFPIGDTTPSRISLLSNVHLLARFAALSQEAELVPIVEPEVLMDGSHDLESCERVTQSLLNLLFKELLEHRVVLEGLILKTNMIVAGKDSTQQVESNTVARSTVRCLRRTVPPAVPGIAFLSGGQNSLYATRNLDAINRTESQPWRLTFSFSRALQEQPMELWKGDSGMVQKAQTLLLHRAKCNATASMGRYSPEMEKEYQ